MSGKRFVFVAGVPAAPDKSGWGEGGVAVEMQTSALGSMPAVLYTSHARCRHGRMFALGSYRSPDSGRKGDMERSGGASVVGGRAVHIVLSSIHPFATAFPAFVNASSAIAEVAKRDLSFPPFHGAILSVRYACVSG